MAGLREPVVLALDIGTSSVRAVLHDARGRPAGPGVHLPYQPRVDAGGRADVDAGLLVRLTERCLDEVLREGGEPVAAVGISTFWHGLLGLRGGRPATPVILWSDTRSWREAVQLRDSLDAEAVHQRTGCPIHPSYWPAKLAWAAAHRVTAERWCSFGDLLFQRWFGDLTTSLSMASATGLFRLRRPGWDGDLAERLKIGPDQLPAVDAGARRLPRRLARRWPRLEDADFVPAAGDGALANLGSACVDPSRRALTVGTSGALRAMTERVPRRLPPGLWCYRLDGRRLVVGGSFSNGGNFHAWVLDTLRIDEAELERRLERMRPAAHGLVFLPLLAGERSPGFAPHATGAVTGLTLATTPADLARAGMEGIALDFATVDARLDRAVPGGRLLVGGGAGLVRSAAFAQMMADATGKRLVAAENPEASARGAALLALEHLGVTVSHHEPPAGRTFVPRRAAHRALARQRPAHEALYRALVVEGMEPGRAPAHLRRSGPKG